MKAAKRTQALSQVNLYADVLNELNESAASDNDTDEESEYSPRESTPSATSSGIEDEGDVYQFLTHNGDSYVYKLPTDSLRWVVSGHDVSQSFINYRDATIKKAEDLIDLNDHEQLALDGIMLIDNDFVNTDIVDYHVAQDIMKEIDEIDYCKPVEMEKAHADLVSKFARDLAVRNIDQVKIEAYIKDFKNEQSTQDAATLCDVLNNLSRTYSADYSTNNVNEATLVRDTVENLFKVYFPNTTLTKSVGADSMIRDSAKRFTKLDPSLNTCGKRADFSVVSNKAKHVLLSLEAKSNKIKGVNDLIKLCRELKDTIKTVNSEQRSDVVLCGILMKGNCCDVYCMDHNYDGLYRVMLLKKIYLPHDCYEMHQLLSILPLFQKLKSIIQTSALILRNPPSSRARIPDNVVSMHTPTIVRVSKRKLDKDSPGVRHARRRLFKK